MDMDRLGFGIAGALDPSVIRQIAAAAEGAGFHTIWVNDTPDGDSLAGLAAAAEVTSMVGLASGVIPLDRQNADAILRRLDEVRLPGERLTIGVGSGRADNALRLVETGVQQLKRHTPARIFMGALGPKMRALAVEQADGLLLNMLTLDGARQATDEMHQVARARNRPPVRTALYVRTSLGDAARKRLVEEAERYERIPSYAAHFARLGARAVDTAVIAETAAEVPEGLGRYAELVDETVLRAITATDSFDEYRALIDAVTNARSERG